MRKSSTVGQSPKRAVARQAGSIAIGMDLGDKTSRYCVLGEDGEPSEDRVATSKKAMLRKFSGMRRCRIAIEVGTFWASCECRSYLMTK